jgi:hypothetical protein
VCSAESGQLGLGRFDEVVGMREPSISTPPELHIASTNGVAHTSSQINSAADELGSSSEAEESEVGPGDLARQTWRLWGRKVDAGSGGPLLDEPSEWFDAG